MKHTSASDTQGSSSEEQEIGFDQPNFVAFRVSKQDYCVDILSVREISGWTHVTPLPKSAPYIRGVINLRGSVVPVLDCPVRFGLGPPDPASQHVIIVIQVGERTLGLLVDEVSEILNILHSAVKPVPESDDAKSVPLVTGVIVQNDRMVRVVDLAQIAPEMDLDAA